MNRFFSTKGQFKKTSISNIKNNNESFIKSQVYCDNEILMQYILDAKPSKNGLYPHEIIMIFYADIGHLKTINTSFASIFKYQYYVQSPSLLLQSLISRKYIRTCNTEEIINYLQSSELKELMKLKGLKCKGKFSNENMKEVINQNYTSDEIYDFFKFLYYVPSEKGKEELRDNEYLLHDRYNGWKLNCDYAYKKYISVKDINLVVIDYSKLELHIEKEKSTFTIFTHEGNQETIRAWVHNLPEGTKLSVFVDGKLYCNDISVDTIYFMRNVCKIALCHRITEKSIDCICYDYQTEKIAFKEKISDYFSSPMPNEQYKYSQMIDSLDGIIEGNKINYFVSIRNVLASYILSESLKEKVDLVKLDNYLDDDNSLNYKVTVNLNDTYTRNIIVYMLINKLLDTPVIKDAQMCIIMDYLRRRSSSKTLQTLMENDMIANEQACEVVEEVKKSISYDWKEVYELFIKTYPKRIFMYNPFECYSSKSMYFKDVNWQEVKNNYSKWNNEFIELVQELTMKGVIHPRWINEFSLYVIAKAFFPDAIYQYRVKWLGQQSLDIFIPSIKTGIEYQGIQHYEAIDYFSGEDGFEKRKELDERKRSLCKQNGIRLIEWPYTIEVNVNNFAEKLKEHGIKKSISNEPILK